MEMRRKANYHVMPAPHLMRGGNDRFWFLSHRIPLCTASIAFAVD